MILLFSFSFFTFFLSIFSSELLELKTLKNASIPSVNVKDTVENLSYEKLSVNESSSISLSYILISSNQIHNEKIELRVNNESVIPKISKDSSDVCKGGKICLIRTDMKNSSIAYEIKFSKMEDAKTGVYELLVTVNEKNLNANAYIFSVPIVKKFSKAKLGLEGDPLRINCVYYAYPDDSEIRWYRLAVQDTNQVGNVSFVNETLILNDNRTEIKAGKETKKANDTLYIKQLTSSDNGIYKCEVISEKGRDFSLVKVNVKDRWAALYPFIGIVIEVVILVTAILAYEKYQIRSQNRKNYPDNADEDNKEPAIPLATGGGDDDNGAVDTITADVDAEKTNTTSDNVRHREALAKNV